MAMAISAAEKAAVQEWLEQFFPARIAAGTRLPFSFQLDGREITRLPEGWQAEWEEAAATDGCRRRNLILSDPESGLQCRCELTCFDAFPAVEWVLYLKNGGEAATPILADIQALDLPLPASDQACRVHHSRGSDCRIDDFQPLESPLDPGKEVRLATTGGRSSNGALPFFNLQIGNHGVIGAVGWTGDWAVTLQRDAAGEIRTRAGMQRTHLRLYPGEEIRTPRMLLLFWDGERLRGHNLLRRLILAHHAPQQDAPICFSVWGENRVERQLAKAGWLKDHAIPLDMFWIDAGWHGDGKFQEDSTVFNSDWYKHVGNWWPNRTTYPEGLRPVGEALREMGYGFLLWLEPERCFRDTYFPREHPEWLFGPIGDNFLFNLGNPEARRALTDLVSDLITEGEITCYRQDFNTEPAPFWQAADAPDRVGMSEIRHIEGLYAFWDELRARHPGLLIDNCSSGGRRIDLETISRSIPLWRSDFQCYPDYDPIGIQGQNLGLGLWAPLSTGCCDQPKTYCFRSALGPGMVLTTNRFEPGPSDYFPPDWLRARVAEEREARPYFLGDFYPLLSYSLATDSWAAWQYNRPEQGDGMVVALRRQDSPFTRIAAPLHDLDPEAEYEVRCVDAGTVTRVSGSALREQGLALDIHEKPGSELVFYRRVQ